MRQLLLIEDKTENMMAARSVFEGTDQLVDYATNLSDAMKLLDTEQYDLIITDLFFPEFPEGIKLVRDKGSSLVAELIQALESNKNQIFEVERLIEVLRQAKEFPLGLEIIKEARRRKVPYIITTDLGGHGSLGEAALTGAQFAGIQQAPGDRYPLMILMPKGGKSKKETPEFWERAWKYANSPEFWQRVEAYLNS